MRVLATVAVAMSALCVLGGTAFAKPPIEAFADLPQIRAMELSPDGKKIAYIERLNGEDVLTIYDTATSAKKGLARVGDIRARSVAFLGNDYVVLRVSKDRRLSGAIGKYEISATVAFNINTGANVKLPRDTIVSGQILGMAPGGKHVMMAAPIAKKNSYTYDLVRVSLDNGSSDPVPGGEGTPHTADWMVDSAGRLAVREDFNADVGRHILLKRENNGDWTRIFEQDTDIASVGFAGMTADGKNVYAITRDDSDYSSLYSISIADGKRTGPIKRRDDAEIEGVVRDTNGVVYGVVYTGMYATYDMFDKAVQTDIEDVIGALGDANVYLDSWSSDWSKLLFIATGGKNAERYVLYDRTTRQLRPISNARPQIKSEDVGEVVTIEYKARDGLKIPALVTWPAGVAEADRKNLPIVVMPHGGPEAYDSVSFDWLAQFIANEGYIVLQPNFRGSAGFGISFRQAGHGEWGRKMQDDITDGLNALVKMGWADPNRACIVGWSYGGYAALAGGARTPELYKCVVAVAGVSDLGVMLNHERDTQGPKSMPVIYWQKLIGNRIEDREAINEVSPALHADKFNAPVLLIHGAGDTVVPIRQSEIMNDALRAAKKPVDFVRIDGDDHSLVEDASRRRALTAISDFLKTHIGPKPE